MVRIAILLVTAIVFHLNVTAQTVLVPYGAAWQYLEDGSDQGTAWRAPTFNDESWKTGNARFGYGLGDEATQISFGPEPSKKYTTTYFLQAKTGIIFT